MSRYSVDTDALRSAVGRCEDISINIGKLAIQIVDVKRSLDNDMGRYNGVIEALNACISNSSSCKSKVGWYGITGQSIANKYSDTEVRVSGDIVLDKFDQQPQNKNSSDWVDSAVKIIAGAIGSYGKILNAGYMLIKVKWKVLFREL